MPINRYKQLLTSIPKGTFYESLGEVLPHRSDNYDLSVDTGTPNREYLIYVNDQARGSVVTNGSGLAVASITLDLGTNEIIFVDTVTQSETKSYVTTRDYATWMAAQAEVLETIDSNLDQIYADSRIGTASLEGLENVFAPTVNTANSPNYSLDTYRDLLQELRTAYRYYGATKDGIFRVVSSFTGINPLMYPRSFGPDPILGQDFLYSTKPWKRSLYSISTLPNINIGGAGVSIVDVDPTITINSGSLYYRPGIGFSWKPIGSPIEGSPVQITTSGEYTIYGPSYFQPIIGMAETYVIDANNNKLYLDIDNKGILEITLTTGAAQTAVQVATDINNAFMADVRYGVLFGSVASSYAALGTARIAIAAPAVNSVLTIHVSPKSVGDATQTLFNIPNVRGRLDTSLVGGETQITLSASSDMNVWPLIHGQQNLKIIIGNGMFRPPNLSGTAGPPGTTEIKEVTSVDRATRILKLATPITAIDHIAGELVELDGQWPYVRTVNTTANFIKINVTNPTALPIIVSSDSVTISGSGAPERWFASDGFELVQSTMLSTPFTYFDVERDAPIVMKGFPTGDPSEGHMLQIPVPDSINTYKGYEMRVSVWGMIEDPTTPAPVADLDKIDLSFDNRVSYSSTSPTIGGTYISSTHRPRCYTRTAIIPPTLTKMWIKLKLTPTCNGNFVVHRVRVTIPYVHDGLYLGHGFTPRNESREKQGQFMYVWSKDILTTSEKSLLGMTTTQTSQDGHIDLIGPDAMWLERFDMSRYSGGAPTNIFGAFTDTDFSAGTLTHVSIVLRTPSRFSHLIPTIVSDKTDTVVFSGGIATLSLQSNQDETYAILMENGIPFTKDQWSFTDSTHISLVPAADPTKTYTFFYQTLIQFETAVIDLGASFADNLWFADFYAFLRPEVNPTKVQIVTGIQFNALAEALLDDLSDLDQSSATLMADNGITNAVVLKTQWNFANNRTVRIDPTILDTNALYTLTYNSLINHPNTSANILVELKSATIAGGLGAAVYSQVDHNTVVGNTYRYHKMRITLSNIKNVKDVRVQTLLLKGF